MDQANKNQPAPADAMPLKPNIVGNIPLHQAAPAQKPAHEADDIDAVMKEVGQQLKQEDKKPEKHHWFGHKQPPQSKGVPATVPTPAAPEPPAQAAGSVPRQPAPKAPAFQAKSRRSVPVMAILFTLIITAFLVVAAISAFKK